MKKSLLFIILICVMTTAGAQDLAKGTIFNDINKNNKLDKAEKGIAGVSVSNGIQVVQTDKQGKYQLPVGKDNIIFISKPANYVLPLNDLQQPRFYHIHKPAGSPRGKYAGVEATGKLPEQIDFPLIATTANPAFTALIFGDPQAYNMEEMDYFKKGIVSEAKLNKSPEFGLSLGDLVGDDLTLHKSYIDVIAELNLPWYNVMGNHDMNYDVQADSLSDESFEAAFGPNNYSFNYGDAHFIVLDDILYPNPRTGNGYLGGFRKDQLEYVENDLKLVPKDKLIVLAFHIPLFHENSDIFRNEDRQRLFDLLAPFPNTLSLSAHTHYQTQLYYKAEDGWKQAKPHHEYNVGTTSGDWYSGTFNKQGVPSSTMRDGTPKGYMFLKINGNKYEFDYKVAGEKPEYQIMLFGTGVVAKKYVSRHPIYANFFIGRKEDVVEYRLNGGEWKKMKYAPEIDPNYTANLYKYDGAITLQDGRRPSDPVASTHLWRFNLPKLDTGSHLIEVRATDMFGRQHTQTKTLQVVENTPSK
jgi:3',5'-cyclic AMP phosphodiesterase CpdA